LKAFAASPGFEIMHGHIQIISAKKPTEAVLGLLKPSCAPVEI